MAITQLPEERTTSATTRRATVPSLQNAGAFDPDELCRKLELYKQDMRQARRLREARLEQGHKAGTLTSAISREKQPRGSEDEEHQLMFRTLRKRISQFDTFPCSDLIVGASSSSRQPVLQRASYRPQSAAVDFAKTTTSDSSSRAKTLKRLSASHPTEKLSLTDAKRPASMQDEAFGNLRDHPLGKESEMKTFSQREKRRPSSSMASLGFLHSRQKSVSRSLVTNVKNDKMERWPSFEEYEPGISSDDGCGSKERQDKDAQYRDWQSQSEKPDSWVEHDGQLREEKSRLTKRFSKMMMNVRRSEPRTEGQHAEEPISGTSARRRSSFLGLFK